jgi:hypothetical protein
MSAVEAANTNVIDYQRYRFRLGTCRWCAVRRQVAELPFGLYWTCRDCMRSVLACLEAEQAARPAVDEAGSPR